jgi:hypothetical protein
MPTIDRVAGYRIGFYSNDRREPQHVHVRGERGIAKFWLIPVRLASARGFREHELNWIRRIIEANEAKYLEDWHDYFSDDSAGLEGASDS